MNTTAGSGAMTALHVALAATEAERARASFRRHWHEMQRLLDAVRLVEHSDLFGTNRALMGSWSDWERQALRAGLDPYDEAPEWREPEPIRIQRRLGQSRPLAAASGGILDGFIALDPETIPAHRREALMAQLGYGPEQDAGVFGVCTTEGRTLYALLSRRLRPDGMVEDEVAVEVTSEDG